MALEIHTMLVVSTGHVTNEERHILDDNGYSRGEYGWLLYVGNDANPVVEEIPSPSPGLVGAIKTARNNGCTYLLLDRDAEPIDGIPVYQW
jgi:hypothetical protein